MDARIGIVDQHIRNENLHDLDAVLVAVLVGRDGVVGGNNPKIFPLIGHTSAHFGHTVGEHR